MTPSGQAFERPVRGISRTGLFMKGRGLPAAALSLGKPYISGKRGTAMKISIVYHSSTGRTEAAAKEIVKGIEAVEGMEAVLIPVSSFHEKKDEYVKELQESAGVLFGTPDYYAAESWQLKQWLDTCPVSLGGKLGGAFATSNVPQGGPVMAIESILTQLLVKGMLIYSGGTSLGKPNIHLGPVCTGPEMTGMDLFPVFGQRFASKAKEIFR
jgi:NAD(P)H dehydrogenase (quinone)